MTKTQALREFKFQAFNRKRSHENNVNFTQTSTERSRLREAVEIIKDTDWAIERLNRYEFEWFAILLRC